MRNQKMKVMSECAIMLALAFALSCAKLYEMPLGGSVTVASMLPIMLISIKYGYAVGLGTGFCYSLMQCLQALASNNVFPYCQNGGTLVLCIAFDYIVPFTVLGLCCLPLKLRPNGNKELNVYIGVVGVVLLRFLCHFCTGVAIWNQWAPDGMGKYLYSFLYNGSFLGLDFLICMVLLVAMMRSKEITKLINL